MKFCIPFLTSALVLAVPSMQGIVHYTRSFFESENEGVVNAALEYFSTHKAEKPPFRVIPPLLALREDDLTGEDVQLNGQFVRFMPTRMNNGCFLAVLTKEADDPREVMVQIIARAEAKGIIKSENIEATNQDQQEVTSRPNMSAVERSATVSSKHSNVSPQSGAKRKHSTNEMKKSKFVRTGTGSSLKHDLRSALTKDAKSTRPAGDEGSSNED